MTAEVRREGGADRFAAMCVPTAAVQPVCLWALLGSATSAGCAIMRLTSGCFMTNLCSPIADPRLRVLYQHSLGGVLSNDVSAALACC